MAKKRKWLQAANQEMERKGTKGSFGPATERNIARGKHEGGKERKKAIFAENMRKIARKRHRKGRGSARR